MRGPVTQTLSCVIFLIEVDEFYDVLLVEIRHLIRLTGILLHQESTVGKERGVSPEVMSGGYCGGVPPLPIPNREVKPACADGTAMQCGRVGGRLLLHTGEPRRLVSGALLFSFWRDGGGEGEGCDGL